MVSVHEHIGAETLEYANGVRVPYRQSLPELARRLRELPWRRLGVTASGIAAVCLPMPCYLRYRRSPVRDVADVCARRNDEVLAACAAWGSGEEAGQDIPFLPWPGLLVTSHEPAVAAERRYRAALNSVVALKWHPAAESRTPADFMRAGYLDLAAERGMPLIVHCARRGTPGDLADLLGGLLPAAAGRQLRVSVAHAGFLHPRLPELAGLPGVFTDCGPWEAICSSVAPELGRDRTVERLAQIMSTLRERMCLGFDTPWHVQYWDDGRRHGRSAAHDLEAMARAAALAGLAAPDLLFRNARKLLFSPGGGGRTRAQPAGAR